MAATKTDRDSSESNKASDPEAIRAEDPTFSPCFLTYLPSRYLTTTATPITKIERWVYEAWLGLIIFLIDSTNEVIPAYKTRAAIIREEIYSILPYPIGCFLSGALLASFSPIIVTTDDKASLRLFTASSISAIELTKNPKESLKTERITFINIPIILVLTITLPLASAAVKISKLSCFIIFPLLKLLHYLKLF